VKRSLKIQTKRKKKKLFLPFSKVDVTLLQSLTCHKFAEQAHLSLSFCDFDYFMNALSCFCATVSLPRFFATPFLYNISSLIFFSNLCFQSARYLPPQGTLAQHAVP
jgi:hypothetical protein